MFNKIFVRVFAMAVIALSSMSANAAKVRVVTNGLVSYWTFDRKHIEGNTAKDIWGDNNGTIKGAEIVEGKIRQALNFDGVDDHVVVPNSSDSLSSPGEGVSIVVWINTPLLRPDQVIVAKGSLGEYFLRIWAPNLTFGVPGAGGGNSKTALKADTWYHIAATYDGETAKLYIDGSKDNECLGWGLTPNQSDVWIGGWPKGGGQFQGIIDEVGIYNRVLTGEEVSQDYKAAGFSAVEPSGKLSLTWGQIKATR